MSRGFKGPADVTAPDEKPEPDAGLLDPRAQALPLLALPSAPTRLTFWMSPSRASARFTPFPKALPPRPRGVFLSTPRSWH